MNSNVRKKNIQSADFGDELKFGGCELRTGFFETDTQDTVQ